MYEGMAALGVRCVERTPSSSPAVEVNLHLSSFRVHTLRFLISVFLHCSSGGELCYYCEVWAIWGGPFFCFSPLFAIML